MKLLLTLSLALGLLSWVTVACTPSEGPQKSKSVVGDLEPLELRPTAIVVQPKSEVSRRLETLSGGPCLCAESFWRGSDFNGDDALAGTWYPW